MNMDDVNDMNDVNDVNDVNDPNPKQKKGTTRKTESGPSTATANEEEAWKTTQESCYRKRSDGTHSHVEQLCWAFSRSCSIFGRNWRLGYSAILHSRVDKNKGLHMQVSSSEEGTYVGVFLAPHLHS